MLLKLRFFVGRERERERRRREKVVGRIILNQKNKSEE